MKKRLRKKLGLKEFQELGFAICCNVAEMDEAAEDALFDQIIALFEKYEMHCGGFFDANHLDLEVCTGLVNTDNQARYEAAKAEFMKLEGLSDIEITELC